MLSRRSIMFRISATSGSGGLSAVRAASSASSATTAAINVESSGDVQKPVNNEIGKPIPSPALPAGIWGKILGHAGWIRHIDKTSRQSPFFQLFAMREKWYKETGSKTIQCNMAGNPMVFCSDPAVYREILGEKQSHFTNSNTFRDVFGFLFPRSMIVLEGEDWQRVRRVSQRAINRMDMDTVIGSVNEVVDSAVQVHAFDSGEDIDTYKFLSFLTFDVFHKVMYSLDPKTITGDPKNPHIKLLENCEDLLFGIQGRTFSRKTKWMWNFPTKANRKLEGNRKYILNMGEKIAQERREALAKNSEAFAQEGKTKSLLDGLVLSQQEDKMTNQEVADQIATFFFGAYETTSNTLLLTLCQLAEKPEVQQKLRDELLKKFPNGRADIAKAKLADLDSVKYLMWTMDESFRMTSTAPAFPRDCIKDVVVGGFQIKKGTGVSVDHRTVSHDPVYFSGQTDLQEFKPDRYEKYPLTDKLLSMPFGFGARICPGRRIAIAETKTVIASLVSEYRILPPKDPSKKLILDQKLGLTCADGTGFLRFERI